MRTAIWAFLTCCVCFAFGCADDESGPESEEKLDPNAIRAMGPMVEGQCIDGLYGEVPPMLEPIDDLIEGYTPDGAYDFVRQVLERRFPNGLFVFDGGMVAEREGETCFDTFLPEEMRGDVNDVLFGIDTLVHECGHFMDGGMSDFGTNTYVVTPKISFTCSEGDAEGRGGVTFARSLLNTDEFSALRPPCEVGDGPNGCDGYAMVYLDGDAFDDTFDSGDQGYNMLLEEALQYINSLAAAYAVSDESQYQVSARDGLLTFVWYIARYLRLARTQYPDAYAHLSQDPCWREATLTIWGRAWVFLEGTQGNRKLELEGRMIEPLASDPWIIDEMNQFRGPMCD